ncbi:hypothetical protein FOZ63_016837, partial [Perkinsus olseni]
MSRQFLHRAVLPVSAVACGLIAVNDSRNCPRPRVWCEEDPRDWTKDEMKHKSMEEITMGQYGKWTRLWNSDWDGRNPREDAKKVGYSYGRSLTALPRKRSLRTRKAKGMARLPRRRSTNPLCTCCSYDMVST